MKKKFVRLTVCLVLLQNVSFLRAEEDTFVSLTRRATPVSSLPTNISTLSEKDIKRTGAQSVADVLDLLPSVDISRAGSLGSFATARGRGVPSSSHTQILIDDQPLGGISQQFIDLSQIPASNIERIEIVRGGSSVLYGANTIGGAIHIITKKNINQAPYVQAGYEGRSYKTHIYNAAAGGSVGRWNGLVTGNHYTTDGFQHNSDANQKNATATGGYSFSNGARVSVDYARAEHELGNPKGTLIPIGEWDGKKERDPADPNASVEQDNTQARVNGALPMGNWGTAQTIFFGSRQNYLTRMFPDAAPNFKQRNKIVGNDTRLLFNNGWTVGGAYERDDRDNFDNNPLHITNVAGYVEKQFDWTRFHFIPAVRYDDNSAFGSVTNPRITAVYNASERWKLSTNIASSYRAPSFLELYYRDPFFNGNPDLKPEKGWTYDVGSQYALPCGQIAKLTGYYTKIKDRIAPTLTTYENLPTAEMSGGEFELGGVLDFGAGGQVHDTFTYAYQRALGSSGSTSHMDPLRLTPTHMIAAQIAWVKNGWDVANTIRYVSDQFQSNNYGGERLPPYALWNIRVSKKISVFEIFGGVENITDRHYAESFDNDPNTFATTIVPEPARSFSAGVNIRFQGKSSDSR